MFAVDVDLAVKLGELSVGRTKKLVNRKSNLRVRLIEPVGVVCERDRSRSESDDPNQNDVSKSHAVSIALFFASDASVFKSGVRESGNRPKRLPSAKAGSALSFFSSCTPVIRASSVSKWEIARRFGSFLSR